MPSFSNTLEEAIHRALGLANARRHELATLEHLLLALVDEAEAARVMRACGVDLDELRQALTKFIDEELEAVWAGDKTAQAALDSAVERGDQLLRRFERAAQ